MPSPHQDNPRTPDLSPSKYISRLEKLQVSSGVRSKKSVSLQLKRRRLERLQTSSIHPPFNTGPLLFVGQCHAPPHLLDAANCDITLVLLFIQGRPLDPPVLCDDFEEGDLDFSRLREEEEGEDLDEIIEVMDDSDDSELQTPRQGTGLSSAQGDWSMDQAGRERKPEVRLRDEFDSENGCPSSSPLASAHRRKYNLPPKVPAYGGRKPALKRARADSQTYEESEEKPSKTPKTKAVPVHWPTAQTRALWVGKLLVGDVKGDWDRILEIVNANGPERSQKQLQDKWHSIRKTFPISATQAAGANAWGLEGQTAILQGFLKFGGAGKSWDNVVAMVNTKDTSRVRSKKQVTDKWQSMKKDLCRGLQLP